MFALFMLCFVLIVLFYTFFYLKSLTVYSKIRHCKHMEVKVYTILLIWWSYTYLWRSVLHYIIDEPKRNISRQNVMPTRLLKQAPILFYRTSMFRYIYCFQICLLPHRICIGKVQLIDFLNSTFVFKLNSHFALSQTKKDRLYHSDTTVYPKHY